MAFSPPRNEPAVKSKRDETGGMLPDSPSRSGAGTAEIQSEKRMRQTGGSSASGLIPPLPGAPDGDGSDHIIAALHEIASLHLKREPRSELREDELVKLQEIGTFDVEDAKDVPANAKIFYPKGVDTAEKSRLTTADLKNKVHPQG